MDDKLIDLKEKKTEKQKQEKEKEKHDKDEYCPVCQDHDRTMLFDQLCEVCDNAFEKSTLHIDSVIEMLESVKFHYTKLSIEYATENIVKEILKEAGIDLKKEKD